MIDIGDHIALLSHPEERPRVREDDPTYIVKGIIRSLENIDLLVLNQVSGNVDSATIMSEHDCKYYGIKYMEGLQIWHRSLDWFNITKWRQTTTALQRARISDTYMNLRVRTDALADGIVDTIKHQKHVDLQNHMLRLRIRDQVKAELTERENQRIGKLKEDNNDTINRIDRRIEKITKSIHFIYEQAYINRCRAALVDDCLASAGVRAFETRKDDIDIHNFVDTGTPVRLDQYEHELKAYNIFREYIDYASKIKKMYDMTLSDKSLNGVRSIYDSDTNNVAHSCSLIMEFENKNDWFIFRHLFDTSKISVKDDCSIMLLYQNPHIRNEARLMLKHIVESHNVPCLIVDVL